MKKINQAGHDGFTLIELLMTVLIIGILAIVGITQFSNFSKDAKNAAAQSNLAILRNAIGVMNAMERIRCGKTSLDFPFVGTLQSNDITGCTNAPAPQSPPAWPLPPIWPAVGVNAVCNFANLADPKTNVSYLGGCAADNFSDADYMVLFPMVDRPFVQNVIPPNPWQSAVEKTLFANTVTADTPNAQQGAPCLDSPIYNTIPQTNATECGSAVLAGSGTVFGTAAKDGGWCYCQSTGQIWANTGNNDGKGLGTGNESLF